MSVKKIEATVEEFLDSTKLPPAVEMSTSSRIFCNKCKVDKQIYRVREALERKWKYMCKKCIKEIEQENLWRKGNVG